MPTYEYECQKCKHRFDAFQSMTADRLTDCPEEGCDGTLKRLIGAGAGLLFKGSGFYITDYRSDSYKSGAKKESKASSSGSGSSSKSDGGGKGKSSSSSSSSSSSGSANKSSGGTKSA
ncbi:MAG: zinc ribbon domain-containing protein [Verrucomicrobiales bacterium]|nr:zinc ribbon domain-containing protein [Verrucomicrobiales bacterium]